MPTVGGVRSVLDPRTAIYTVRVPLADIPDGVTVRVRAIGSVDGVEQAAEMEVTGGAQFDKDGNPRTEAVLSWTLPHGFFNTKDVPAERWGTLRAQRWGQTAKSSFTLRTEIEAVKGQLRDLPACTDSVAVQAADEKQRYHHSIAIENATSAVEEGGDGTISVSFTANTGSNRAALVVSGSDRSGQVGTHTTTYGGSGPSVTRPWNVTDGSYSRCTGDVFKDSEIGSGAKTIQNVCDVSTDGGTTIAVLCLSGVDQTTPVGTAQTAAATSGNPSVTVTGLNSTDVIVDGLYMWGSPGTIGANQTQQTTAGGSNNHTNISTQSGADGGVMSWTGSGGEYSYGAVAFKEAAAGGTSVTPGIASLTLTAFAPTVTATANQTLTPGTASLTLTARTPTATVNTRLTPGTATLALTAFAPSVATPTSVTPSTATLTLTAFAPTVTTGASSTLTPGIATLTLTSFTPTVTATANQSLTPGTATLTLTAFAPTVTATANQTLTPGVATLTLTALTPTVTVSSAGVLTPGSASLTLTAFAPTVTVTTNAVVTPGTAALTMTLFAPVVSTPVAVTPGVAALILTGYAPTITATSGINVTPASATLTLTGYAPSVVATGQVLTPLRGVVTIEPYLQGTVEVREYLEGTAEVGV